MIANSTLWRSRDGGKIWAPAAAAAATAMTSGGTRRPAWPATTSSTGDGGMGIYGSPLNPTGNTSVSLPIGQMYRVTIDQRSPYWVYSDRQDDGSMRIASDRPIVPANVPSYAPALPMPGAPGAGGGAAAVLAREAPAAAARARGRCGCGRRGRRRGAGGGGGAGGGRGGGGAAAAPAQESMPSCESGYTYPEPNNSPVRVGHLLRVARRDLRRTQRPDAVGESVDPHARSRSGGPEVPLPLVAAAGDRLVRQLGLLRLPAHLPHARSRPDVGGDQPGSVHARSQPHPLLRRRRRRQPRPVLRRGRVRHRAVAHCRRASCGRARTTARSGSCAKTRSGPT